MGRWITKPPRKKKPATWKQSPTARRTAPMPTGWAALRKRILERDGKQCTAVIESVTDGSSRRCDREATHVDHIVPVVLGGSDSEANLASLCAWHHNRKTAREANAAKQRNAEQRTEEKHPGML